MTPLDDGALDRLQEVARTDTVSHPRYQIGPLIASGGMGSVYQARDLLLDRDVAIKVLRGLDPSPGLADRLDQEARILARLDHPGLVPVHDAGVLDDGRPFYVMRLVRGKRLDHAVARAAPGLAERLRIFLKICEPVAFAHAQGIVHRDLKPANIMVGPYGEVLVLDWGIAKVRGTAAPSPGPAATPATGDGARRPRCHRPRLGTRHRGIHGAGAGRRRRGRGRAGRRLVVRRRPPGTAPRPARPATPPGGGDSGAGLGTEAGRPVPHRGRDDPGCRRLSRWRAGLGVSGKPLRTGRPLRGAPSDRDRADRGVFGDPARASGPGPPWRLKETGRPRYRRHTLFRSVIMKRPVLGLVLGGVLGAFDGLSGLLTAPEVAPQIGGIVGGSVFKGILVGALVGWVSRRVTTVGGILLWGGVIGLFFAALVSLLQKLSGQPAYYWQIMLPGTALGMIVGFATFRHREKNPPAAV